MRASYPLLLPPLPRHLLSPSQPTATRLHTRSFISPQAPPKPTSKPDVRLSVYAPPPRSLANICISDYELARTFHPDAPAAQALPATVRHARFHAVTRAYDVLRGKPHTSLDDGGTYTAELARRRRQQAQRQAYRRRAAADFAETVGVGGADEAWKDQLIIIVGLAVRTPSLHPLCFHPDF